MHVANGLNVPSIVPPSHPVIGYLNRSVLASTRLCNNTTSIEASGVHLEGFSIVITFGPLLSAVVTRA